MMPKRKHQKDVSIILALKNASYNG